MLIQKVYASFKRLLPTALSKPLRALMTALLTPAYFSWLTGHWQSALRGKPLNRAGAPIPWYTYPAIQLVENKDYRGRTVAEFGAGNSTLWWAQQAAQVVAFEEDEQWFNYLKSRVPANVELHHLPVDLTGIDTKLGDRRFDVVIVDGLDRFKAVVVARRILKPGGLIIVDNAEGYWGAEGTYPIMDFMRAEGFQRLDLYGFAPGVLLPHCTSIFWKDATFVFAGQENPKNYVRAAS